MIRLSHQLRLAALLSVLAFPAAAQGNRAALVDSARVLIEQFEQTQSMLFLQRAANPALGAPDGTWANAVQMLAQILIRNNQGEVAAAWLRWAHRLEPRMQVDSVSFNPALVAAFYAARDFVARSRTDTLPRVRWEWVTASAAGGFGDLRVETTPANQPSAVQLNVEGVGFLDAGRARRLAPGSYRIAARTPGLPNVDYTTEVLPGVTTVVTINVRSAVATLTEAAESRAVSLLARVDAQRLGASSCAAGVFAGGPGLLVTSYRSIRGAEALSLLLPTGARLTDNIRIAAYDVTADLAVLAPRAERPDSLSIATDVRAPGPLWAAHFANCGTTATVTRVAAVSASRDSIRFGDNLPSAEQSTVVLTATGAVAGLAAGPRVARTLTAAAPLLATARRNLGAGTLLAASDVALRERHALGEAELRASQAATRARVSPLDQWQWPEVARVATLPFTFQGPMGRYLAELLDGEQVRARSEFVIEPGRKVQVTLGTPVADGTQPAVGVQRKKRSLALPIIGGLAAGGVVAVLAGGKKKTVTPPVTTGGIIVRLP